MPLITPPTHHSPDEMYYHQLFDSLPISIWEEDYSDVQQYFNALRTSGVVDFRQYFLEHPEAVAHATRLIKVLAVNQTTLELYGAKDFEDLCQNLNRIFTDAAQDVMREEFIEIAEGATRFDGEGINHRLDGCPLNIHIQWAIIRGAEMDYSRVIVSIMDITPRKKAETALHHRIVFENLISAISTRFIKITSGETDSVIQESLKEIGSFTQVDRCYVFLLSADGRVINNSHEWCAADIEPQIKNLQNMPVEIMPWWMEKMTRFENIHIPCVADMPAEASTEREILQTQDIQSIVVVPIIYETHLLGFIGFDSVRVEKTWLDDEIKLLRMAADILANAIVHQRNEAELTVQRDFAMLAMLVVNTMGQGLTVTNADGYFEFVNPAFVRMLGYTPEQIIGKLPEDFTQEADHAALRDARACQMAGEVTNYEILLNPANGKEIYVLITGAPRRSGTNIIGTVSVVTDLSEHKRMEDDMAVARDRALEASRLKSEFVAMMSHEIRTPMNGIIGMTEILLESPLNKEQHEFCQIVFNEAQSLLNVINEILDFSKIEAGKLLLDETNFELISLVEDVIKLLAPRAAEKNISLIDFVDPRIPMLVHGDAGRLRQVLLNLVGNAVKFTKQGEILVQANLIAMTGTYATLRFSVQDTGIGIPEETHKLLFQPFTQVQGGATRRFGGTGLGLAISKRLVELMGGEIGLDSIDGQGSTFWFKVDLKRVEHSDAQPTRFSGLNLHGLKALVVNDNRAQGDILQNYLVAWGIYSRTVSSANEAIQALRAGLDTKSPYHVAFIDLDMPGINSCDLATVIRTHPQLADLPMIMVTAYNDAGQVEQAIKSGFFAYLSKPIKQSRLYDLVATVVKTWQEEQLGKEPPIAKPAPAPHLTKTGALQAGKLILIVEDNPTNQKLAMSQLNMLGYSAVITKDGFEAVHAVETVLQAGNRYGLILMDIQMPELDGFNATQEIRALERAYHLRTPIVAVTAHAMTGYRERCLDAGMDDYISKPVHIEELQAIVERWLGSTQG